MYIKDEFIVFDEFVYFLEVCGFIIGFLELENFVYELCFSF